VISYKVKIQTGSGRYVEYEDEDFEVFLQQVIEDFQDFLVVKVLSGFRSLMVDKAVIKTHYQWKKDIFN